MSEPYNDFILNSKMFPIASYMDDNGSIKINSNNISSSNFDGFVPYQTSSVSVAEVMAGDFLLVETASGVVTEYRIVSVNGSTSSANSYYEITYLDDEEIVTASYSSSAITIAINREDWDNASFGTYGWTITHGGNAIFSNMAARGGIEALYGYIGGQFNSDGTYNGWEISSNLLSNASVGFYAPSAISGQVAIFAGAPFEDRASAVFRVNYDGSIVASSATITGALTATTLDVGGANGITYDGASVVIGTNVTILKALTVDSLQVGTSPNILKISASSGGVGNDGIYINSNNYWYTDGRFSTGGSANSVVWSGSSLTVTGKVIATSGSFSGDITASAGRFIGAVSVSSSGNIYAGSSPDSGQRTILNASGLFGYHSNGLEAFALPVSGSPRLGTFIVVPTGIVSQSASNANMVYGNVDSSGTVTDGIVIRGHRTTGASAAIYTVQNGVGTSYESGNGFYVDENARFKLSGNSGSLNFDGDSLSITGNIIANSGSFRGGIYASVGTIGGWIITSNSLYSTGATASINLSSNGTISIGSPASRLNLSAASPTFAMWSGGDPQTASFSLTYTGNLRTIGASLVDSNVSGSITAYKITASVGQISGFNLSASSLVYQGVGITTGNNAIFAGALDDLGSSAPFLVRRDGSMVANTASITGKLTAQGDFSVDTNVLYVNSSTNRIGINEISPLSSLHVVGDARISASLIVGSVGTAASSLHVVGSTLITNNLNVDAGTLYVDSVNNEVGINTTSPASALHVVGAAYITQGTTTGSVIANVIHATDNGNGTNFRVGDDVWIGDINLADTISIRGISGAPSNGYIRFGSDSNSFGYNGTILSYGGNISLGGTASIASNTVVSNLLQTNRNVTAGTVRGIQVNAINAYTTNWNAIEFTRQGTELGYIRVASAAAAPTLVSASDYRLKKNIEDDNRDFIKIITGLRPVSFEWKNPNYGGKTYGFIAHEVQEYIPEAVGGIKDGVDEDGNIVPQDLTQQPFVYYLVGAFKESVREIEILKSKVLELESRLNKLDGTSG